MFKTAGVERFLKDKRGTTAIEYAMGVSFVAVAIVGALGAVGSTLERETFAKLNGGIITASISKDAEEGNRAEPAPVAMDPIQTGSTEGTAGFEVEGQLAGNVPDVLAREPDPKKGPPIYTVSTAGPGCNNTEALSSCRPAFGQAIFDGWKGTSED